MGYATYQVIRHSNTYGTERVYQSADLYDAQDWAETQTAMLDELIETDGIRYEVQIESHGFYDW